MTINPLPTAGPSFENALNTFLSEEDADRFKNMFTGFIVAGGLGATIASLTHTPAGVLTAYPGGHFITETGSITYPDDATHVWVICHKDTTSAITNWTRESGTHYLFQNTGSATTPTVPTDSALLMKVTTASGSITNVEDSRSFAPTNKQTTSETILLFKEGDLYKARSLSGIIATNTDFVDLWDAVKGGVVSSKRIIIKAGDVYALTQTMTIPISNYGIFDSRGTIFRYSPTSGDAVIWKGGQGAQLHFGLIDMENGSTGSALRVFPEFGTVTLSNRIEWQGLHEGGGGHVGKGFFMDSSLGGMGIFQVVGNDILGFDEGIRVGIDDVGGGAAHKFWLDWIRDCNINIVVHNLHNTGEFNINLDALIDNSIAIKTGGANDVWNVIIGAQAPDPTTAKTLVIDSGAKHNVFNIKPALNRFKRSLGANWEDNSGNRTNIITGDNPLRGNDNLVINGGMQINREGTATGVGAADGYFGPDLWEYSQEGTTSGRFTARQVTLSSGQWLEYEVTTADVAIDAAALYSVRHNFEANDVNQLRFGTSEAREITISFEHRHVRTGTYCLALTNSAENRIYVIEYVQDTTDTDEYEAFTIKPDVGGTWITTGSGVIGLRAIFIMAAGANLNDTTPLNDGWTNTDKATANQINGIAATSDRFRIRKVQLEIGQTQTEFQHEERSQTLSKCQRYLWTTFPEGTAPAQSAGLTGALTRLVSAAGVATQGLDLNLPVTMASTPTATFFNPSAANALWRNVTDVGDSGAAALRNFGERGGGIDHTQVGTDGVGDECAIHVLLDARL